MSIFLRLLDDKNKALVDRAARLCFTAAITEGASDLTKAANGINGLLAAILVAKPEMKERLQACVDAFKDDPSLRLGEWRTRNQDAIAQMKVFLGEGGEAARQEIQRLEALCLSYTDEGNPERRINQGKADPALPGRK